uniref:Nucleoside-diphosphate kinase n=1 Tax=Corethron hystrix TaxID=216773 RepID=A0A7S1B8D5_9STRA|mmetsp:Transcript_16492/g.37064  ORF Transcript_16492/g.37064 Transcript_16492/m.37064 type:complete len:420 (+) Transcript_16492:76-1335(+)|eukprot:CAMPEP_0113313394 /NCGR_PEP_ID=MMETSP0010_2-20120614/9837_1 /TAXON_ID=216773 ORGANISM="Corethron hystrix, Strain 308" /NCGR_SAMPLE_ID=MMETSP0010_2 /ASSEMBLY_ACC=CAM_ASM_000155 /LENGTH=419 /DNA_ID=CAMNT_0000169401 /DNA_START=63 /DNA_END=1322 /DNA_ORIENTATION=+ /assembly_acc=CAM_ASM_000155
MFACRSIRPSAVRFARATRTGSRSITTEASIVNNRGSSAVPISAVALATALYAAFGKEDETKEAVPTVVESVPTAASIDSIRSANYQANELLRLKNKALASAIDDLQVQLSGKTNSAFVFIKPHACKGTPGKVEGVVEENFAKNGIRVTGKGEMPAETIDKNMHIDTHYGAIASKAVKLKPDELNVPDKGKADFEKMFGEKWDDAVKGGKVYNAKDGAAKLGTDAAGLNEEWSKLSRGKDLIKFGGGFYCGKVGDIYVMNGFYMSMRAAYTNPGEKIIWYTVSWPADALSWADFRGKVLGATDPSAAPVGSARRTILDNYEELGLATKPNTGDNGVHASASPFEALAERVNWLGANVETDAYGKGLLAAKVQKDTIVEWSGDSQVSVDGETSEGKTMSVFDTLEDLDADDILAKVSKIH